MYLIDDIVYLKPFTSNGLIRDVAEHSNGTMYYDVVTRNGIIRDVVEHSNGTMYYDVEVQVDEASNGNYYFHASEDQLEYNGEYYQ